MPLPHFARRVRKLVELVQTFNPLPDVAVSKIFSTAISLSTTRYASTLRNRYTNLSPSVVLFVFVPI